YEAGDALGVRPKNCPELVSELEQLLRLNAEAPVLVDAFERPLHQALLEDFEICRPSREMLKFIADRSGSHELQTLFSPERQTELQQWLWGRQLVDVLHEFPITCSCDELVAMLKPLQPRLYSISSSAKLFADQVHLTMATVRYTRYQDGKKIRKGVSSTFLAERAQDENVPIFVQT